jgi:hypothetical protein
LMRCVSHPPSPRRDGAGAGAGAGMHLQRVTERDRVADRTTDRVTDSMGDDWPDVKHSTGGTAISGGSVGVSAERVVGTRDQSGCGSENECTSSAKYSASMQHRWRAEDHPLAALGLADKWARAAG